MADGLEAPGRTVEQQLTAIQETLQEHGVALRSITDGLAQLLDMLSPKVTDGPTLDEILGQLVTQIGDQGVILRRVDGTAIGIADILNVSRADHAGDQGAGGEGAPTVKEPTS